MGMWKIQICVSCQFPGKSGFLFHLKKPRLMGVVMFFGHLCIRYHKLNDEY